MSAWRFLLALAFSTSSQIPRLLGDPLPSPSATEGVSSGPRALKFVAAIPVFFAADPASAVAPPVAVRQLWASHGVEYAETDSLAACRLRDGGVHVFATAKRGDRLDIFDARDGRWLRSVGRTGRGPGEFRYPNGIAVIDPASRTVAHAPPSTGEAQPAATAAGARPVLVVVERDNRRVQALDAETGRPLGTFGEYDLHRPYGVAVSYQGDDVHLYVTDTRVPPEQTVKQFAMTLGADTATGRLVRSFGAADGPGAIGEAESIVVDDRRDRVYLCDEERKNVKIYTRNGDFAGRTIADGVIRGDPEGIVLYEGPTGPWLIVTDQRPEATVWHVFDGDTLAPIGRFTGTPPIANTDGICLCPGPVGACAAGLLLAVHDDREVRAYCLDDVRKALPIAGTTPADRSKPPSRTP